MELFEIENLGKSNHVFGAVVVDFESFTGGVFAEVDVSGAVEHAVNAFHFGEFCDFSGVDCGNVAVNDFDIADDFVKKFGNSVEFALFFYDVINAVVCAFDR